MSTREMHSSSSLLRWLGSLQGSRARRALRLQSVQQLEQRCLPSAFSVVNLNDGGAGSLRQAILDANAAPGADTIEFAVAGTIGLTSGSLPILAGEVDIDGSTAPGFSGAPVIEIDFNGSQGLRLGAGSAGSEIRSLALVDAQGNGITVSNVNNIEIAGNFIGLGLNGITAAGNRGAGILLLNSSGNVIGGDDASDRNVISANLKDGIRLTNSSNNQIRGNRIGTDAAGALDRGNGENGIRVASKSSNNVIGGETGNILSGNALNGVLIEGKSSSNAVSSNLIGLALDGTTVVGNGLSGVRVRSSDSTVIGNFLPKYETEYSDSSGFLTPVDAWRGIDEGDTDGQFLMVGDASTIGHLYVGTLDGVGTSYVVSYPGAFSTRVSAVENLGGGNFRIVGTYKNADFATAPVEVNGFLFEGTTADLASPANYRTLDYPGAKFNFPQSISGGLIISNYDSAADHGAFGLPYGPGHASVYDIASDTFLTDINFPGALSNTAYAIVHNGGTSYTIAGGYSLDGTNNFDDQGRPIGTPFLVDYDTSTGLFTHWTSLSVPGTTARLAHLTGLSRLDSNTYTFSAISAPAGDPVDEGSYGFVRRNNDGSFGTPTWVELQVDGYDPDTNVTTVAAVSGNHVLGVVAATGGGGVNPFQATITTTYPTSNIISGNGQHGILLENADNGRISGNFIGTDITGLLDRGNLGNGILITSASTGNLIGGQEPFGNDPTGNVFVRPPQGNVISGNELNGVLITNKSIQNVLSGNFIGVDVTGLVDLGNELDGVAIVKAANNSLIGATLTTQPFAFYNVVGGNNRNGLRIAGSKNTIVQGNYFGHGADASSTVGNTLHGILIDAKSTGSLIGGASPLDNDVSGNGLN